MDRQRQYPLWTQEKNAPLHFVTAADKTHEKSLLQLLESIRRHESNSFVVVYDLGMSLPAIEKITQVPNCELESFDFSDWPEHFDIRKNAGEYAWKPVLIQKAAKRMGELTLGGGGLLCWLDAGCLVLGKLVWLRRLTLPSGFFSPFSSGSIDSWTHDGTLDYLQLQSSLRKLPLLHGGIVCFRPSSPAAMKLLDAWVECAMDRQCIAPLGSSRSNHRQDQSALSVLATKMGLSRKEYFKRGIWRLRLATHMDID